MIIFALEGKDALCANVVLATVPDISSVTEEGDRPFHCDEEIDCVLGCSLDVIGDASRELVEKNGEPGWCVC